MAFDAAMRNVYSTPSVGAGAAGAAGGGMFQNFLGSLSGIGQGLGGYIKENPTNFASMMYQLAASLPDAHPAIRAIAGTGGQLANSAIASKAAQAEAAKREQLISALSGSLTPAGTSGLDKATVQYGKNGELTYNAVGSLYPDEPGAGGGGNRTMGPYKPR